MLFQIANNSGYIQVDWKRVEKDVNKAKKQLKYFLAFRDVSLQGWGVTCLTKQLFACSLCKNTGKQNLDKKTLTHQSAEALDGDLSHRCFKLLV